MFEIELFICIKMNLALSNLRGLICHKAQASKQNGVLWGVTSRICSKQRVALLYISQSSLNSSCTSHLKDHPNKTNQACEAQLEK